MRRLGKKLLSIAVAVTILFVPISSETALSQVKAEQRVLITKTGSKYHSYKCGNGTYYQVSLSEAQRRGLGPCSKCYSGGGSSYSGGSSSTSSPAPKDKKMSLNKTKYTLVVGGKVKLKVRNAKGKVKWSSKKKPIAKVNSKGEVKALRKGTTYIVAKCGNQTRKCKIKVEKPSLNKTKIIMGVGDTQELKFKGCGDEIDWYSQDDDICDVDLDDSNAVEIEAYEAGTTNVIAKVHGKKYKCKVVVVDVEEDEEWEKDELIYGKYNL